MEAYYQILDDTFRDQFCNWHRDRYNSRIRIWDQLVKLFLVCWGYFRSTTGYRRDPGIFSRINLRCRDVFRVEQSQQEIQPGIIMAGCHRCQSFGIMDPCGQWLDAKSCRYG